MEVAQISDNNLNKNIARAIIFGDINLDSISKQELIEIVIKGVENLTPDHLQLILAKLIASGNIETRKIRATTGAVKHYIVATNDPKKGNIQNN